MVVNKYILVLFLWVLSPVLHPLHLSVSNVDFNDRRDRINISVKIFIDDIQDAIYKSSGEQLKIVDDCLRCDSLIDNYVRDNFKLYFGPDSLINLEFLKIQQNDEAIFVEYISGKFKNDGYLIIRNSILNDLYEDQKNLVFVADKERNTGFTLDKKNTDFKYDLN